MEFHPFLHRINGERERRQHGRKLSARVGNYVQHEHRIRGGWCRWGPESFPHPPSSLNHTHKPAEKRGTLTAGLLIFPRPPSLPNPPSKLRARKRCCHPPHEEHICLSHLVTALSCSEIVRRGGDGARGEQNGAKQSEGEREGQKRKEKTKKTSRALLSMTHPPPNPTATTSHRLVRVRFLCPCLKVGPVLLSRRDGGLLGEQVTECVKAKKATAGKGTPGPIILFLGAHLL